MKLYHGTSAGNARRILAGGALLKPFLTSCDEQAAYYAECAGEEARQSPVVIVLEIPDDLLAVDFNAYEEPLTYFRKKWATSEEDWHEKIESGDIPYPEHAGDIHTALQVTGSLRATVDVGVEFIQNLDEVQAIADYSYCQPDPSPGF